MPLKKSPTKQALQENIKKEIKAGKSRGQAVAIAFDVMEKAKKVKK